MEVMDTLNLSSILYHSDFLVRFAFKATSKTLEPLYMLPLIIRTPDIVNKHP